MNVNKATTFATMMLCVSIKRDLITVNVKMVIMALEVNVQVKMFFQFVLTIFY